MKTFNRNFFKFFILILFFVTIVLAHPISVLLGQNAWFVPLDTIAGGYEFNNVVLMPCYLMNRYMFYQDDLYKFYGMQSDYRYETYRPMPYANLEDYLWFAAAYMHRGYDDAAIEHPGSSYMAEYAVLGAGCGIATQFQIPGHITSFSILEAIYAAYGQKQQFDALKKNAGAENGLLSSGFFVDYLIQASQGERTNQDCPCGEDVPFT